MCVYICSVYFLCVCHVYVCHVYVCMFCVSCVCVYMHMCINMSICVWRCTGKCVSVWYVYTHAFVVHAYSHVHVICACMHTRDVYACVWYVSCVFMCMCMACMHLYGMYMCMCVCILKGWCWVFFSCSLPSFMRQALSVESRAGQYGYLASQVTLGIPFLSSSAEIAEEGFTTICQVHGLWELCIWSSLCYPQSCSL